MLNNINIDAWYNTLLDKWQYLKRDEESRFGCVCVCKYVFMSVYHIFLKNGNYWNILHVMVQWKGRVEDTGGSGKWN